MESSDAKFKVPSSLGLFLAAVRNMANNGAKRQNFKNQKLMKGNCRPKFYRGSCDPQF